MPVITDIKRQAKRDRYNVYLDGSYSFALSNLDLSTSGLRIGRELTASEVEELQQQAGLDRAYNQALRFLSYRPRSKREMRDYLKRKEVPPEEAEQVVARLEKSGLLNDKEFGASWVANRQALRPRSKRRLAQELQAKGLGSDDIEVALSETDPETEYHSLLEVAVRKARLSQYRMPDKLMAYLLRQGYPYEMVKRVVAETAGPED